jgi:hypothetical protein
LWTGPLEVPLCIVWCESCIISGSYLVAFPSHTYTNIKLSLSMQWNHMESGHRLHSFLTSATVGDEWSASRSGHFNYRERVTGTRGIGGWAWPRARGWVWPRADLPVWRRENFLVADRNRTMIPPSVVQSITKSSKVKRSGREAITQGHSVPRLRMLGVVPPFIHMTSCCAQRQNCTFIFTRLSCAESTILCNVDEQNTHFLN